jgi:hypothetical protein
MKKRLCLDDCWPSGSTSSGIERGLQAIHQLRRRTAVIASRNDVHNSWEMVISVQIAAKPRRDVPSGKSYVHTKVRSLRWARKRCFAKGWKRIKSPLHDSLDYQGSGRRRRSALISYLTPRNSLPYREETGNPKEQRISGTKRTPSTAEEMGDEAISGIREGPSSHRGSRQS